MNRSVAFRIKQLVGITAGSFHMSANVCFDFFTIETTEKEAAGDSLVE